MRNIDKIIIHSSASAWGSAAEIRRWHLKRGFNDIGYHFVIQNGWTRPTVWIESLCGNIEVGRAIDQVGAHAKGHNYNSIGICLIANTEIHTEQIDSLVRLVSELMEPHDIKIKNILGHCELPGVTKTCPNFNVKWLRNYLLGRKLFV